MQDLGGEVSEFGDASEGAEKISKGSTTNPENFGLRLGFRYHTIGKDGWRTARVTVECPVTERYTFSACSRSATFIYI